MKRNDCSRFFDYSIICPGSDSLPADWLKECLSPHRCRRHPEGWYIPDYDEPGGRKHGRYEFIQAENRWPEEKKDETVHDHGSGSASDGYGLEWYNRGGNASSGDYHQRKYTILPGPIIL